MFIEDLMSLQYPKPNHNHASEYQVSSWPFVTSSTTTEVGSSAISVKFPYITRWFQVTNIGAAGTSLRIGFTEKGVQSTPDANYLLLTGSASTDRLEIKCSQLWFLKNVGSAGTGFSLIAGLTNVSSGSDFPIITGSNGFAGVG